MKGLFNLHTHTHYCDGSSAPEDYVKKAIELGFHTLGYSGHAPVPFKNHFAIKEESLKDYVEEIKRLRTKHSSDLNILLGLEIDFITGVVEDFKSFHNECDLDYCIGGIHLVANPEREGLWFIDGSKQETYDEGLNKLFDGDIKRGVKAYYDQMNRMIDTQTFQILAHFDKIKMHNKGRYFQEDEKWYQDLLAECIELIAQKDFVVEVNTRGIYKKRSENTFPGISALKVLKEKSVPITINSDAHKPEELNLLLSESREMLKQLGIREIWCLEKKDSWKSISL